MARGEGRSSGREWEWRADGIGRGWDVGEGGKNCNGGDRVRSSVRRAAWRVGRLESSCIM